MNFLAGEVFVRACVFVPHEFTGVMWGETRVCGLSNHVIFSVSSVFVASAYCKPFKKVFWLPYTTRTLWVCLPKT